MIINAARTDASDAPASEPAHEPNPDGLEGLTLEVEKRVGHRLNVLMTDPVMRQVHQQFGGHVFRRSSVYHGLATFLAEHQVRGECCFEIGSWNGLTALILARHFRHVVSVDIAHNAIKRDIAAAVGAYNIEFVDILDNNHKRKVAEATRFDCAYLDGNHAEDTEADFNLTRSCGRVLFHEAWEFQPPVWTLLESLPQWQVKRGGTGLALWDAHTPDHARVLWERSRSAAQIRADLRAAEALREEQQRQKRERAGQ